MSDKRKGLLERLKHHRSRVNWLEQLINRKDFGFRVGDTIENQKGQRYVITSFRKQFMRIGDQFGRRIKKNGDLYKDDHSLSNYEKWVKVEVDT